MNKYITYILTQVKTSSPIPIIGDDIPDIEENISNELQKTLKKILTKLIEQDFCLDNINDDNDDRDSDLDNDYFVNLRIGGKKLNSDIKKNLDSIIETIIYNYVNIKCRQEYINGNRETAISYFPYIDVNYNYYKNSKDQHSILYYATSKEDIEVIKIILEKKPHDYYEIRKTENFEIIGLYIDYICDNKIDNQDQGNYRFYLFSTNNQKEFIIRHPRAKDFLGRSYDDIAEKYFNSNF
ncbi:hypothetical protein QLL95_gp0123 [Cotonvirus japonicus]|uniref:Uncharacterized protein n=1 Tax=Cotonvirus japonicus TaxID=2811091 RepID=A0ABM7NR22_9VIRU|nr:hypothetical protein QLL95_gp0123 [Cotonvirus japonicus]BCS82612.1 hypothetical protein [Cotonvirus japonicus]